MQKKKDRQTKKLRKPIRKYDIKKVIAYTGEDGTGCNCC